MRMIQPIRRFEGRWKMSRSNRNKIRRVVVFCSILALIATLAVAQSWNYQDVGNYGYWRWGSTDRFRYDYGAHQWWDIGMYGVWRTLGASGWSAAAQHSANDPMFVGNGGWHDVGTGLSYRYASAGDYSNWLINGNMRFAYTYGTGQWADYYWGTNTWSLLGPSGISSTFLGDGAWHTLGGTGFRYRYERSGDYDNWLVNGAMRFAYTYGNGLWADYSSGANTWSVVGSGGLSSSFLGDGGWHTVGTGLSYRYASSGDSSNWQVNGALRFAYTYGAGQWADYGANTWCNLGPTRVSSAFLGDGGWHTLDSIWSYEFLNGYGYLRGSVSTWVPGQSGGGYWGSSPTQFTCNYTTQVLGLYDSGSTSSVFVYDFNGGSSYSSKWTDWNYSTSSRSEISAAIVFYTGSVNHSVSSWLSWLPVNPNPGAITRTETWDFSNNDYANRYNHEARAFANSMWLVQREQGSIGNCGIIASIDSFEAATGLYVGQTNAIMNLAIQHGWSSTDGGSGSDDNSNLMAYLGTMFNHPVTTAWDSYSFDQLATFVSQGYKVDMGIDLGYLPYTAQWPEFGSYYSGQPGSYHATVLLGFTMYNGVYCAEITSGWNIRSNTTVTTGNDAASAYPITMIPASDLRNAYNHYGWAAIVR